MVKNMIPKILAKNVFIKKVIHLYWLNKSFEETTDDTEFITKDDYNTYDRFEYTFLMCYYASLLLLLRND